MAASDAFQAVKLDENDVPGAKFVYDATDKHSNIQLMRWLECRGLPKTGNRSDLLKRVHSCLEAGHASNINVSVDSGHWYEIKLKKLKGTGQNSNAATVPLLPYSGWGKFPSRANDIPKHFNKGHIHHHIVESVQFVNECDVSDENDDIEDLHTAKPLKRGLLYFESGHVQKIQDNAKPGYYFLKAKVMASYRTNVMYDVTVTLSQLSGFVVDASCTCVASAMGRCSHMTGLLYYLASYLDEAQTDKSELPSCTSVPCSWNQGRKNKKEPRKVQDSNYSSAKKKKVEDIINFDPRAPSVRQDEEDVAKSSLIWCAGVGNQLDSMWMTLLNQEYSDYALSDADKERLKGQIASLRCNLKVASSNDFPVEIVKSQKTESWYNERRVRITASNCKDVSTLKSESAITNCLDKLLWKSPDSISAAAISYGLNYESTARKSYQSNTDSDKVKVIETGFWVSGTDPELACSPDGLIIDLNEPSKYGLLEIKCPKSLEGKTISDFDTTLTKSQLKRFFLEKDENGIGLKKSHKYFYQTQMQMGVTGLKFCDFVVWSSKEVLVRRIRFDAAFWIDLKEKLLSFHHTYLCAEYFEMRVPRGLTPIKME